MMIKEFMRIWRKPTPLELAAEELAEAERSLLVAASSREYASAMVRYHEERISRLRAYITDATKEANKPPILGN